MLNAHNAFRWVECALSEKRLNTHVPPPSEATLEGRAAHAVAAAVLTGDANCAADLVDRDCGGIQVTPEIATHVQTYLDFIGHPSLMHVEKLVSINDFISVKPDCVIDAENYLHIIEFKYGYKIVEPYVNYQLILGAAAFLRRNHEHIKLTVVQPRAHHRFGPIRTHVATPIELDYHFRFIKERAQRTFATAPAGICGNWCADCLNTTSCQALTHSIYEGFHLYEECGLGTVKPGEMKDEFKFLCDLQARVKTRLNALEAEIEARMKSGEYLPELFLKPRFGNRTFCIPAATIEALTGKSAFKQVPVTPADLEKEGVADSVLNAVTTRPQVGHKIAILDKREIERIFAHGNPSKR
jgi:hypothetical protein